MNFNNYYLLFFNLGVEAMAQSISMRTRVPSQLCWASGASYTSVLGGGGRRTLGPHRPACLTESSPKLTGPRKGREEGKKKGGA